jgi:hypothetical protein
MGPCFDTFQNDFGSDSKQGSNIRKYRVNGIYKVKIGMVVGI